MPAEAEAIVSANETGRGRNSGVQIEDESHIQLFIRYLIRTIPWDRADTFAFKTETETAIKPSRRSPTP